jgi:hypothetical protein
MHIYYVMCLEAWFMIIWARANQNEIWFQLIAVTWLCSDDVLSYDIQLLRRTVQNLAKLDEPLLAAAGSVLVYRSNRLRLSSWTSSGASLKKAGFIPFWDDVDSDSHETLVIKFSNRIIIKSSFETHYIKSKWCDRSRCRCHHVW